MGCPSSLRRKICPAIFVANPGCYPDDRRSCVWRRLVEGGLIETDDIIRSIPKAGVQLGCRSDGGRGELRQCTWETNEARSAAYAVASHSPRRRLARFDSPDRGQNRSTFLFHAALTPMDRGFCRRCTARSLFCNKGDTGRRRWRRFDCKRSGHYREHKPSFTSWIIFGRATKHACMNQSCSNRTVRRCRAWGSTGPCHFRVAAIDNLSKRLAQAVAAIFKTWKRSCSGSKGRRWDS